MSFESLLAEARRRRRSSELPDIDPDALLADADRTTLLGTIFRPAMAALEGMAYVDAGTRTAAGSILGSTATGPDGTTSGDDLLRSLGLDMGENQRGVAEFRDVPGFLAEVAVSPFNLLGPVGGLTKAGRTAARASALEQSAAATAAAAKAAPELRATAAQQAAALAAMNTSERLAPTMAEQSALGQRRLLQFAGQSVPVPGEQLLFTGLDKVRRRVSDALPDYFRSGGKTNPFGLGGRGAAFNALREATEEVRKSPEAADQAMEIARGLGALDPQQAEAALARVKADADAAAKDFVSQHRKVTRLETRIDKALKAGEPTDVLQARLSTLRRTLAAQAARAATEGGEDARNALVRIAAENLEIPETFDKMIQTTNDAYNRKTLAYSAQLEAAKRKVAEFEAFRAGTGPRPPWMVRINPSPSDAAYLHQVMDPAVQGKVLKADRAWGKLSDIPDDVDARASFLDANNLPANPYQEMALAAAKLKRVQIAQAMKLADLGRQGAISRAIIGVPGGHRVGPQKLPPGVIEEAERLSLLMDSKLEWEQRGGVPVSELGDRTIAYVPRIATDAAKRLAEAARIGGYDSPLVRHLSASGSFTRRRSGALDGMSISAVNQMARELNDQLVKDGIRTGFNSATDQFFLTDLDQIALERLTASARRRSEAAVLSGIVEMFAAPAVAFAGRSTMPVAEYLEKSGLGRFAGQQIGGRAGIDKALKGTRFEGAAIPRDLAAKALEAIKVFDSPEALKPLARVMDKYNSAMRFWVTSAGIAPKVGGKTIPLPLFPAYHMRNMVSNAFLMFQAGMRNPAAFSRNVSKAFNLQRLESQYLRNPARATAEAKAAHAQLQRMRSLRALSPSQTAELSDIANVGGRGVSPRPSTLAQKLSRPTETENGRAMMGLGTALEDNAKIALYLDGKARGLTDIEAANRTRQYLFDYSELSDFDRRARRWAYFWTFFRKNVPLQFAEFMRDPNFARQLGILTGAGQGSLQGEMLTERDRERAVFAATRDSDGNQVFLDLGLPINDLFFVSGGGGGPFAAIEQMAGKVASLANPVLRFGYETAFRTNPAINAPTNPMFGRVGEGALGALNQLATSRLAQATPVARVATFANRTAQVLTGERPPSDALTFAGVTPIRKDPETAKLEAALRRVDEALRERLARGQARETRLITPPAGADETDGTRMLARYRSALARKLAKKEKAGE